MLLLALLGGLGIYAATGDKKLGLATGAGIAVIALLLLYLQGKASRDQIEEELNQLDEQEQEYWRPVIDNPELLQERMRAIFEAA